MHGCRRGLMTWLDKCKRQKKGPHLKRPSWSGYDKRPLKGRLIILEKILRKKTTKRSMNASTKYSTAMQNWGLVGTHSRKRSEQCLLFSARLRPKMCLHHQMPTILMLNLPSPSLKLTCQA